MTSKIIVYLGILFSFCLFPSSPADETKFFPAYRVVLDPGHGGVILNPIEYQGDHYDRISKKYLASCKEGSYSGKLQEQILMYQIADKVYALLQLTETDKGWEKFSGLLKKYSRTRPKRIVIQGLLSRKDNKPRKKMLHLKDPNADYRLFDYPAADGSTLPGRISTINKFKPQLVVTLHCAQSGPEEKIGMSAVICPPYSFMLKGLPLISHASGDHSFFDRSPYAKWFQENETRSQYRWFLSDCSEYFTGYPLDAGGGVFNAKFKGYRYNMVSWIYADQKGWEDTARSHPRNTRYADTAAGFVPEGAYWDRERSRFEEYRRDGGLEGYGGDNLYASNELIRHVLTSLALSGFTHKDLRLADPFVSVWAVPLYINAVSAYIELGYLRNSSYQKMYQEKMDAVAEGIAAGIYSLLAGTDPVEQKQPFIPKGTKLDLDKYTTPETGDYFTSVVE
jgi:hypothetical protein